MRFRLLIPILFALSLLAAPTFAADDFANFVTTLESPAKNALAITKSDSSDLTHATRGLYVGGGGNVKVLMVGGQVVTFTGVTAGSLLPIRVNKVYSTDTTASGFIGLY